jgi:macrolide transport system ATP-binding/permease protein
MNLLLRFFGKLGFLARRAKFRRELEEEMAFHRVQAEQEYLVAGMSPDAAHHAARKRFGNDLRLQEQSHEVIDFRFESILQDLRFALRQLRKNPGFTCTAILVLTLGLGASVAIFAFVDAALIQPLSYQKPARLMSVYGSSSSCPQCGLSYPDYLDWKKENRVFSSFEVWNPTAFLWRSPAGVLALRAGRVSGGFFCALGVTPVLGRGFTDADDMPGAPRTVLLPWSTWQRYFGGRDVIGQTVMLDEAPYTVIGVLPRNFHFPPRAAEFWVTIHDPDACRECRDFTGLARLKDGVSVQAALADTKTIAAQLEKEYPLSNQGMEAMVIPLSDDILGELRPILLVLLGGAGLLLLIACVNVASLLLVRAESRRHEVALRGALGASVARLVRQFVTEGVVLVVSAAVLGLVAASGAIHLMFRLIPERVMRGMPYFAEVGLHPRVLLFAGGVALLAVAVFTVTPALRLSFSNLRGNLAEGGRGAAGTTWKRFGSSLVAAELAIAMVLLAGAALLGKSMYRLLHVDLNFQLDHLATLEVDAPDASFGTDAQHIVQARRITARMQAIPGVLSVAQAGGSLPVNCNCFMSDLRVPGRPWNGEHQTANVRVVGADYFRTLQVRLIRGRFFTEADDASKPRVAIVNRALAKRFFPAEDPIGKTIGDPNLSPPSLRQIIGVVDDLREGPLGEEIAPAVYTPFNQAPENSYFLVVRTALDPASMLPVLAAAVRAADPGLGVRNEFTMTEHIEDTVYLHIAPAWLAGGFAFSALLLGVVGLYGVIAYSVSQRTREIGVRMALGAQRAAVYRLVMGEAGRLALVGIGAGLAGSLAASVLMRSLLFGVSAWDIPTMAAVAAVLAAAAALASYFPARRAARINPVDALRAE